ncbi:MAG: hypothetical protein BWY66_00764 [bacterium ADurb.Bin374]|nr:MAG: hypothetical protein BWY66_00764 [bacterium ADurb.Bin374]
MRYNVPNDVRRFEEISRQPCGNGDSSAGNRSRGSPAVLVPRDSPAVFCPAVRIQRGCPARRGDESQVGEARVDERGRGCREPTEAGKGIGGNSPADRVSRGFSTLRRGGPIPLRPERPSSIRGGRPRGKPLAGDRARTRDRAAVPVRVRPGRAGERDPHEPGLYFAAGAVSPTKRETLASRAGENPRPKPLAAGQGRSRRSPSVGRKRRNRAPSHGGDAIRHILFRDVCIALRRFGAASQLLHPPVRRGKTRSVSPVHHRFRSTRCAAPGRIPCWGARTRRSSRAPCGPGCPPWGAGEVRISLRPRNSRSWPGVHEKPPRHHALEPPCPGSRLAGEGHGPGDGFAVSRGADRMGADSSPGQAVLFRRRLPARGRRPFRSVADPVRRSLDIRPEYGRPGKTPLRSRAGHGISAAGVLDCRLRVFQFSSATGNQARTDLDGRTTHPARKRLEELFALASDTIPEVADTSWEK